MNCLQAQTLSGIFAKQPLTTVSPGHCGTPHGLKPKRNRNNNQKPSHSSFRQRTKHFSIAMVTVGHTAAKWASLGFLSFPYDALSLHEIVKGQKGNQAQRPRRWPHKCWRCWSPGVRPLWSSQDVREHSALRFSPQWQSSENQLDEGAQ